MDNSPVSIEPHTHAEHLVERTIFARPLAAGALLSRSRRLQMTADKVVEQIKDYGGVVLKTSLTDANEQALRDALAGAAASDAAAPAVGPQS